MHGTRRGTQGRLIQRRAFKRWIEKHGVHGIGRRALEGGNTIAALDTDGFGGQLGLEFEQLIDKRRVLLDQQNAGGTARGCFKPERAGAREGIDAVPAWQRAASGAGRSTGQAREPVEQRLAHAIGRRSQSRLVGDSEACALPLAADDADLMRSFVGAAGRLDAYVGLLWFFHGLAPTITVTMRSGCNLRENAALISAVVIALMRVVQVSR